MLYDLIPVLALALVALGYLCGTLWPMDELRAHLGHRHRGEALHDTLCQSLGAPLDTSDLQLVETLTAMLGTAAAARELRAVLREVGLDQVPVQVGRIEELMMKLSQGGSMPPP